jgi:hypothetical protein
MWEEGGHRVAAETVHQVGERPRCVGSAWGSPGSRGFAWFGVVTFIAGLLLWLPVYRYLQDMAPIQRFALMEAVGVIPVVIVIVAAFRPAQAGSRWADRNSATQSA